VAAPNPSGEFTPLTLARILDTGDGNGTEGKTDPIEANSSIDVQVTGRGGVPETGGLGGPAQTVPNLVTVRVPADGMLSFYQRSRADPCAGGPGVRPLRRRG
jgi:hypothetical protein